VLFSLIFAKSVTKNKMEAVVKKPKKLFKMYFYKCFALAFWRIFLKEKHAKKCRQIKDKIVPIISIMLLSFCQPDVSR